MSVDLAVWEGPQPSSDDEAMRTFESLYERYVESGTPTTPTERIARYVETLLARYPDITELADDVVDESPWADGPLIDDASGPFFYFDVVTTSVGEEALAYAIEKACAQGLVCFDPQSGSPIASIGDV